MISLRPAVAGACLLLVAACGSSTESSSPGGHSEKVGGATPPSASPTGPASDPCALLSKDDAAALKLNFPGSPGSQNLGASCDFGAMTLTVVKPDVTEEAFGYNASQPVDGLGEKAYYGKDFHWLRVQTAHSRFEVRCTLCAEGTELQAMSGVARLVLTHVT